MAWHDRAEEAGYRIYRLDCPACGRDEVITVGARWVDGLNWEMTATCGCELTRDQEDFVRDDILDAFQCEVEAEFPQAREE